MSTPFDLTNSLDEFKSIVFRRYSSDPPTVSHIRSQNWHEEVINWTRPVTKIEVETI